MIILDVLLGREPKLDDAEENLGKPDEQEAKDLKYHVSRCALRWIMSYRMSRSNNVQIAQTRMLLIIAIMVEVLTSAPAMRVWAMLAKAAGINL